MIKVPPFVQSDSSRCGPTVVKSILAYYDIEASEDELCKLCNHTFEYGCDDAGMKNALEHFGLKVAIYNNSNFEQIAYWISRNIPVIVDWFTSGVQPGPSDLPNGHSSIVVGLDEEKIHVLDPEDGEIRHIKKEDWLRCWFDWRGRETPYITSWEDMVLRQIIVPYKVNI